MVARFVGILIVAGTLSIISIQTSARVIADDKAGNVVLEMRGFVVAPRTVAICPKAAGHIVQIMVNEGQQVKAGDVLAKLESAEQGAGVQLARAELQLAELKFQAAKSGTGPAVGVAQAEIEIAKAKLELARARLEATILRAPISGTVVSLRGEPGSLVDPRPGPGAVGSVCEISDLRSPEIEVDIPERDAAKLRAGMNCRVRIDAYPDREFTGQLTRLGPTANRAKATIGGRVRFSLPDGETRVLPEMSAIVQFLSPIR